MKPATESPPTTQRHAARSLATIRAERDFLLRSLEDLEVEHAAGDLSDVRFRELHDEYTVHAAIALRALDQVERDLHDTDYDRSSTRRPRRWVAATATVFVLIGLGAFLLVRSLSERGPGETISGNAQSTAADLATLARAANDHPDDARAQRDYGLALLDAEKPVDALRALDAASRLDPADPIAPAYAGWIVYLAGLPEQALPRLDAAIAADPAYPDAHFFRGMVLLRGLDDQAAAREELAAYVRLGPPGPLRDQVQALIDDLQQPPAATTTPP